MDKKELLMAILVFLENKKKFNERIKLLLNTLQDNEVQLKAIVDFNEIIHAGLVFAQEHHRHIWKFDRGGIFWEHDVPTMDDSRFKEKFRLDRRAFKKVCEKVKSIGKMDSNMRRCISLEKRVAIALFSLGSAAEYRTVASLFGVGRSTVGEIVIDFCHEVCGTLSDCINAYPPHPQELRRIVEGFKLMGFPQCFGAVDGCHIEVQPKKVEAIDYYNYKGWYSVILLASCDQRSKFTYINIGSTGRNNDSYIFERSSLKKFHEHARIFKENSEIIEGINVPVLLIGDSAFRLSHHMMKPYPYGVNQSPVEKHFNYRLSKCRRVIENAFGQLKARFRKVGRGLQVAPKNVNIIIRACCILHNFLKIENDEVFPAWIQEAAEDERRHQPNHTTRLGENDQTATAVRNAIAMRFQNEVLMDVDEVSSGDNNGELVDGITGDNGSGDIVTGDAAGTDGGNGSNVDDDMS
ncbi:putative nuclease HARBI1 isoform X2 [Zeugodacus cucurbitae]|uniref:putative nuclease HARBI1 isoform X2 n=1 Tax=Zeugodacus cucurbitae TaxID=28588 RepID=UPI0023D9324F|nr:putative nuclease HARBI1 isoform X2 [Zeugodacus cucurbitae]